MKVETFECSETAAEPIEACEEAISLIETMGLAGQLDLVKPETLESRGSRCPYMEMTAEQFFVFVTVCPTRIDVKRYSRTPIPLRALQVLEHAKSLGIFNEFEVWDLENIADKDPVLVGVTWQPNRTWDRKYFALARWGEELESWPILVRKATDIARDKYFATLRAVAAQAKAMLDNPDMVTDDRARLGVPRLEGV
jgi:hypothetical protein